MGRTHAAAYARAKESGKYDKVERHLGNGRPNTFEKAYAMTNPMEYFAETTEAPCSIARRMRPRAVRNASATLADFFGSSGKCKRRKLPTLGVTRRPSLASSFDR